MLRWLTAGESHGPLLVAILEGLPAHVSITTDDLREALARRRLGHGRGARMKFEQDDVRFVGGVRHGETIGGPVAVEIGNTEWPKWDQVMSADPIDPVQLDALARNAPLTRPRPGHADLVGMQKYAFDEARPVLERASARETAARVALGRVASNFLRQAAGATVVSHVVELGGVPAPAGLVPTVDDVAALDDDPVRCLDPTASEKMVAAIDQAHKDGDTLGGVVEVVVHGLPPGLGSHVHWDRRIDAKLAGALMGIQAIKGVEVGDGFELAATPGSRAHDEIVPTDDGIRRVSGHSGGTEGGMTTGEILRVRAAMKPIATVPRALRTVDVTTGEEAVAHHQRSDVCAVPAAGIVAEAMVALVLADAVLEKFGGDAVTETRRNVEGYLDTLRFR
jgi:chorismate synthase